MTLNCVHACVRVSFCVKVGDALTCTFRRDGKLNLGSNGSANALFLRTGVTGETEVCMTCLCRPGEREGCQGEAAASADAVPASPGSTHGEPVVPKRGKRERRPVPQSQAAGAKRVMQEEVPEEVVRAAPRRRRTVAKEAKPVTSSENLHVPLRRSTRQTRGKRHSASAPEASPPS